MNDRLLRRTLRANVAISTVWGLVAVLAAPLLDDVLGVPVGPTVGVGVVALVAAALFRTFAARPALRPTKGVVAACGDLLFGSALVVVAASLGDITALGRWVVGLSGVAVVDLGLLEAYGTWRLHRVDADAAGRPAAA